MGISIILIGGVIAAACGCGGRKENYDFLKAPKKTSRKRTPVRIQPCCGATVLKTFKSSDDVCGETHCAKRRLAKNQRVTIRGGNMTTISLVT